MSNIKELQKQLEMAKTFSQFIDNSDKIAELEKQIAEAKEDIKPNEVKEAKEEVKPKVKEEAKSTVNDRVIQMAKEEFNEKEKEYGEGVWLVPMNTSFIDKKKKDINYMDYKALALFSYFSCRKSEEICDMLGLDISEIEEHRYIYQNYINENIEKFEELSGWKKDNIRKQINKLTKCGNKVFDMDYDKNGKIYYKIMPYVDKDNNLKKNGTFVTIESDILRVLINTSNSNMIKIYCFLKWFLIDYEYYEKTKEIRYIEKPIDRNFICEQIGLNGNSHKTLASVSDDIEKILCAIGLIKRRMVTEQHFGQIKTRYYYSIVPYAEWKHFYKKLGK